MIHKVSIYGNPFVGLFARANEKICLIGTSVDEKIVRIVKQFATPIKISLAHSDLIGLFCAMNSNGIILDRLVEEGEIEILKIKIKDEGLDMNIYRMKTGFSPGNNICTNDFGGLINKKMERKEIDAIADNLGIEIEPMAINGFLTVGSTIFATNKFFIAHPKTSEEEFKRVKEILKIDGYTGTLNSGFPFPSIAIAGNSNGCMVGNITTGYEIYRLNEYW
jgi:putative translation initiation factor eIF-6